MCYTSNVIRIDIPSTNAATLGEGGFGYCLGDLQIVVPSTLLGTYQTADNWSTYADKLVGSLSEATGFNTDFVKGKYEFHRTFKCGVSSTICLPFSISKEQAASVGKFYSFEGIDKSGDKWTVIMKEDLNEEKDGLTAYKPYLFVPYILDGMSFGDQFDFTFSGSVSSLAYPGSVVKKEDNSGSFWTFQGVYHNLTWNTQNTGIYGFAANSYAGSNYNVNPGDFVKAGAGARIVPFRAFLLYTSSNNQNAPMRGGTRDVVESLPNRMTVLLVGSDGDVTAVGDIDTTTGIITIDTWFDMNGHKLEDAPVANGLYIHNGKQVMIKY